MKRTYPLMGALVGMLLFVQPFNVHLPLVGTPGVAATATHTATLVPTAPASTSTATPTSTATAIATQTATPTATATIPTEPPCPCDADTLNCGDFATQPDAQACFDHCMALTGRDVHRLDQNNDGVACESLPPGWRVLGVDER